jgi:hypothetical protein
VGLADGQVIETGRYISSSREYWVEWAINASNAQIAAIRARN